MTPRNVLHIITQLELGGAQRCVLQLLTHLDRRRYAPTLISSHGALADDAKRIPNLRVQLWPSLQRRPHPVRDAVTCGRLATLLRRERFDLVHTHSSKAGILGRWAAHYAGVPAIVHTVHGFGFHPFQRRLVRRSYQWLERRTARITNRLIVVSEENRRAGLAAGIGRPEQYALIRYGIDRDAFRAPEARRAVREELGVPPDAPVVGTVGCLKPQKAPLEFLEVCALVRREQPGAHFLMVGDGALRRTVERRARQLGLDGSLHLVGWRRDVPRLLAAMDVFALGSRWEGLPIACLEARAAGLAIVATAAGGIPEAVAQDEGGLIVPVGATQALAGGIVQLLRDAARRERMGQWNQSSLNGTWRVDRMVAAVERLYAELLREVT